MSEINPKVAKAAMRVAFDAAEYTWIDIQELEVDSSTLQPFALELSEYDIAKMPLLFERMAVIPPRAHWDEDSVITVERIGSRVFVSMWSFDRPEYAFQATVKESNDEHRTMLLDFDVPKAHYDTLMHTFKGDMQKAQTWMSGGTTQFMSYLYYATAVKNTVEETYTCPANPANVKRRRQGKVPMYEWKTLIIDSTIRKRVASARRAAIPRAPQREHDVRGHWVTSKLGKRFWRTAHKRGDASVGTIFHDYQTQ